MNVESNRNRTMKKFMTIPWTKLHRSAITVIFLMLFATGMTACNGLNSSTSAQSGNAQTADTASTSGSDSAQTSANQKADRQQKREAVRKKIEAVLTPDQVKQLETKLQQGEKMRQALSEINLTADQKTKIREIRKMAYSHQQSPAPEATPQ